MIFLRIFKNNRLGGTAAIVLLLFGIFTPSFLDAFRVTGAEGLSPFTAMPFYNLIFGAIHKVPVLNHIVAMLIMLLISYTLIQVGIRDQLLQDRSVMPAIFFILFTAVLPAGRQVSPAMVSSLFYLLCFVILFEVQDKRADTLSIFAASLVLALGGLFSLKTIWFIPLIWVSLWTMRKVTWREFMYPLVAFALLFLFLFTWYWGVRDNGAGFVKLMRENLAFSGFLKPYHFSVYIFYGFVLLLVGIASIFMINRSQTMKTIAQNIYQVLFYMFLAGVLYFIFIARFDTTSLIFTSLPVAFVLSNYFHRKRSPWIHELAMWILLGLAVYVQLME